MLCQKKKKGTIFLKGPLAHAALIISETFGLYPSQTASTDSWDSQSQSMDWIFCVVTAEAEAEAQRFPLLICGNSFLMQQESSVQP